MTPMPTSLQSSAPKPITVRDTDVQVRVFEGDTPIVALAMGAPEDATVERTLPGADHRMHTLAVTIGIFDPAHSEQILIVRYETEGTSFREVIRCPLRSVVQRFAGGRRLEIIVYSVPDSAPEIEQPADAESTEEESSDVWVIAPE
jgi:hypothetical protein